MSNPGGIAPAVETKTAEPNPLINPSLPHLLRIGEDTNSEYIELKDVKLYSVFDKWKGSWDSKNNVFGIISVGTAKKELQELYGITTSEQYSAMQTAFGVDKYKKKAPLLKYILQGCKFNGMDLVKKALELRKSILLSFIEKNKGTLIEQKANYFLKWLEETIHSINEIAEDPNAPACEHEPISLMAPLNTSSKSSCLEEMNLLRDLVAIVAVILNTVHPSLKSQLESIPLDKILQAAKDGKTEDVSKYVHDILDILMKLKNEDPSDPVTKNILESIWKGIKGEHEPFPETLTAESIISIFATINNDLNNIKSERDTNKKELLRIQSILEKHHKTLEETIESLGQTILAIYNKAHPIIEELLAKNESNHILQDNLEKLKLIHAQLDSTLNLEDFNILQTNLLKILDSIFSNLDTIEHSTSVQSDIDAIKQMYASIKTNGLEQIQAVLVQIDELHVKIGLLEITIRQQLFDYKNQIKELEEKLRKCELSKFKDATSLKTQIDALTQELDSLKLELLDAETRLESAASAVEAAASAAESAASAAEASAASATKTTEELKVVLEEKAAAEEQLELEKTNVSTLTTKINKLEEDIAFLKTQLVQSESESELKSKMNQMESEKIKYIAAIQAYAENTNIARNALQSIQSGESSLDTTIEVAQLVEDNAIMVDGALNAVLNTPNISIEELIKHYENSKNSAKSAIENAIEYLKITLEASRRAKENANAAVAEAHAVDEAHANAHIEANAEIKRLTIEIDIIEQQLAEEKAKSVPKQARIDELETELATLKNQFVEAQVKAEALTQKTSETNAKQAYTSIAKYASEFVKTNMIKNLESILLSEDSTKQSSQKAIEAAEAAAEAAESAENVQKAEEEAKKSIVYALKAVMESQKSLNLLENEMKFRKEQSVVSSESEKRKNLEYFEKIKTAVKIIYNLLNDTTKADVDPILNTDHSMDVKHMEELETLSAQSKASIDDIKVVKKPELGTFSTYPKKTAQSIQLKKALNSAKKQENSLLPIEAQAKAFQVAEILLNAPDSLESGKSLESNVSLAEQYAKEAIHILLKEALEGLSAKVKLADAENTVAVANEKLLLFGTEAQRKYVDLSGQLHAELNDLTRNLDISKAGYSKCSEELALSKKSQLGLGTKLTELETENRRLLKLKEELEKKCRTKSSSAVFDENSNQRLQKLLGWLLITDTDSKTTIKNYLINGDSNEAIAAEEIINDAILKKTNLTPEICQFIKYFGSLLNLQMRQFSKIVIIPDEYKRDIFRIFQVFHSEEIQYNPMELCEEIVNVFQNYFKSSSVKDGPIDGEYTILNMILTKIFESKLLYAKDFSKHDELKKFEYLNVIHISKNGANGLKFSKNPTSSGIVNQTNKSMSLTVLAIRMIQILYSNVNTGIFKTIYDSCKLKVASTAATAMPLTSMITKNPELPTQNPLAVKSFVPTNPELPTQNPLAVKSFVSTNPELPTKNPLAVKSFVPTNPELPTQNPLKK